MVSSYMTSAAEMNVLISLARSLHITDPEEAFGRCFAATLALASSAAKRGIALDLIRWQVLGDRDFCDHWAILVEGGKILDLTRVQVDANAQLIHEISEYPPNYRNPSIYPAAILLPSYDRLGDMQNIKLPIKFMWKSGFALVRFDMRTAIESRRWKILARNVLRIGRFVLRSLLMTLKYHVRQTLRAS